uniref:Putative tnf receptor-associated factor 6 n=1 Tax=Amblyomma triste TaxID=251400 RepID=A0A023G8V9_AMBTT
MPPVSAQYTLVGFSPELDWRPLSFVKAIPPYRVCSACGLVRRRTALLPCMHALCAPCYEQCAQDGMHVCPLDGYEWQDEDDVDWKDLPLDQLLKREVKCWNAESGCQHVTAASMITQHFHSECVHHSTSCPKCSTSVPCQEVCAHLRSGTCSSMTGPASEVQDQDESKEDTAFLDGSAFPNSFREAFEKQAMELKDYLERVTVDVSTHGDRLNEILARHEHIQRKLLRQELANGVQNQESLKETLRQLTASNAEIKQGLTGSDTVDLVFSGISSFEKVLKDELAAATTQTTGKLSQIAARVEAISQRRENGQMTGCITDVLQLARLQRTWCEFFVTGVNSHKEEALRHGYYWFYSDEVYLRGYYLKPGVGFKKDDGLVTLRVCLQLLKGDMDEVIHWPFEHKIRLSIAHTKENTIRKGQVAELRSSDQFQKPKNSRNPAVYFREKLFYLEDLTRDGFVADDKLRVSWQLVL